MTVRAAFNIMHMYPLHIPTAAYYCPLKMALLSEDFIVWWNS